MTDQEAKAEAEKIKEEFYKAIPLKGFKGTYSTFMDHATQCAVIDVKHTIEQIERMYPHAHYGSELKKFNSILTELNRIK